MNCKTLTCSVELRESARLEDNPLWVMVSPTNALLLLLLLLIRAVCSISFPYSVSSSLGDKVCSFLYRHYTCALMLKGLPVHYTQAF